MTSNSDGLAFASIIERDVDLLLVEELRCSPACQSFFLSAVVEATGVTLPTPPKEFTVRHNVNRTEKASCQIDIEAAAILQDGGTSFRVLFFIENKIAEGFQERQPERYNEQAGAAVRVGEVRHAFTVLVAPDEYIRADPESARFHARISYERFISFFRERQRQAEGEAAYRCQHRREMLEQAVYKYRRGYTPQPHEDVSGLWAAYHRRACEVAPSLQMQKPSAKPTNSDWITFSKAVVHHPPIPAVALRHKLGHAVVDLEFAGCAAHLLGLRPLLEPLLDPDMRLRKAGKSLALSLAVPSVDRLRPFGPQVANADEGMAAAVRLKDWYEQHRQDLLRVFDTLAAQRSPSGEGGTNLGGTDR